MRKLQTSLGSTKRTESNWPAKSVRLQQFTLMGRPNIAQAQGTTVVPAENYAVSARMQRVCCDDDALLGQLASSRLESNARRFLGCSLFFLF